MKNRLATLVGALALSAAASAQTWIWYPGDYEIWLGNQMNNRRTERGAFFSPFWKTDSHYVVVNSARNWTWRNRKKSSLPPKENTM